MKRAALCAILTASFVMSAAVAARAEDGQMQVRISDLNLQSQEGAQVAFNRIAAQADVFCQANEGRQTLAVATEVNKCVARMSGKAVAQLHAPLVTALYDKASGQSRVLAVAAR